MDLGKTAHAFGGIAQSRSRAALFQYLRLRSAAATRSMAPMRPLVPRVMRARLSGHASLPTNMMPAKLAKNPATSAHAANVVSILRV